VTRASVTRCFLWHQRVVTVGPDLREGGWQPAQISPEFQGSVSPPWVRNRMGDHPLVLGALYLLAIGL